MTWYTHVVKAEANKDALRHNSEYNQYIQNLTSMGYFKGEKEGSQLWNDLETKATNTFIELRSPKFVLDFWVTPSSILIIFTSQRLSFAKQVDLAVSQAGSVGDPGLQEEDDESWLTVDAQDLETQLQQSLGHTKKVRQEDAMVVDSPEIPAEDRMASEQASRLKDLANKVEQFVEGEGDMEGARFEE